MYVGWLLPTNEREKVMMYIPPAYPDVLAHHVTLKFGVPADYPLPKKTSGVIVGIADDGKGVQAAIVKIGGTTDRPDGSTFHITWSIDRNAGRKPVDSNAVIKEIGWEKLVYEIPIQLEPMIAE